MRAAAEVKFEGTAWKNTVPAIPSAIPILLDNIITIPILVLEGIVCREDTGASLDGVNITARNQNTSLTSTDVTSAVAGSGRYVIILADFPNSYAAKVGDVLEVTAVDATGAFSSEQRRYKITWKDVLTGTVSLGNILLSPIPKESALLANYPNPFNPDTWIPYKLAKSSDVTINIYDVSGQLVRKLYLGHQTAGIYLNKDRAAYWDGGNETGEAVASGVYFYQMRAGHFSATKKLVVVK